ncbi:MAG: bifunctional DNA-formamidopyrimidine glycosylase/DNA-(apurinic or apyrimidinic site) lyase [Bdellovibrio sp.]|nr:MAG: bifunctional DNA-formamidopyrimidine glycosylase/DNA-(apurinic or apyrimidinic site) lyase [Bdellovibrio sp.]
MPELPEVEIVSRQLRENIPRGTRITEIEFLTPALRTVVDKATIQRLVGEPLEAISRRAKYILFHTRRGILLSHLGMTGTWRFDDGPLIKHDHLRIYFAAGPSCVGGKGAKGAKAATCTLIYNDPRRFGQVALLDLDHQRFADLGPEPLGPDFSGASFYEDCRRSKATIKAVLMNPTVVVGVGNIYASEVLFRSHVRPGRRANRVSKKESALIVDSVRKVLSEAIAAGGSSIRNFRGLDSAQGHFQKRHRVYGREGEPCPTCAEPIRRTVLAGRGSFWCGHCQK